VSKYTEEQLKFLRSRNLKFGEPDLVVSEITDQHIVMESGASGIHDKFLDLLSKPFLKSGRSLASLHEDPIDEIDKFFDRRKLQSTFRTLILNADKVEHLSLAQTVVPGNNPISVAAKFAISALSKTAPYVERGLVREYVQVVASSYRFPQSDKNESVIRDSILGKNSTLGSSYHKSTRERTGALNKLARATSKSNIDECLSRIDDFYRERLLLSYLEQYE